MNRLAGALRKEWSWVGGDVWAQSEAVYTIYPGGNGGNHELHQRVVSSEPKSYGGSTHSHFYSYNKAILQSFTRYAQLASTWGTVAVAWYPVTFR